MFPNSATLDQHVCRRHGSHLPKAFFPSDATLNQHWELAHPSLHALNNSFEPRKDTSLSQCSRCGTILLTLSLYSHFMSGSCYYQGGALYASVEDCPEIYPRSSTDSKDYQINDASEPLIRPTEISFEPNSRRPSSLSWFHLLKSSSSDSPERDKTREQRVCRVRVWLTRFACMPRHLQELRRSVVGRVAERSATFGGVTKLE